MQAIYYISTFCALIWCTMRHFDVFLFNLCTTRHSNSFHLNPTHCILFNTLFLSDAMCVILTLFGLIFFTTRHSDSLRPHPMDYPHSDSSRAFFTHTTLYTDTLYYFVTLRTIPLISILIRHITPHSDFLSLMLHTTRHPDTFCPNSTHYTPSLSLKPYPTHYIHVIPTPFSLVRLITRHTDLFHPNPHYTGVPDNFWLNPSHYASSRLLPPSFNLLRVIPTRSALIRRTLHHCDIRRPNLTLYTSFGQFPP